MTISNIARNLEIMALAMQLTAGCDSPGDKTVKAAVDMISERVVDAFNGGGCRIPQFAAMPVNDGMNPMMFDCMLHSDHQDYRLSINPGSGSITDLIVTPYNLSFSTTDPASEIHTIIPGQIAHFSLKFADSGKPSTFKTLTLKMPQASGLENVRCYGDGQEDTVDSSVRSAYNEGRRCFVGNNATEDDDFRDEAFEALTQVFRAVSQARESFFNRLEERRSSVRPKLY